MKCHTQKTYHIGRDVLGIDRGSRVESYLDRWGTEDT